jgi:hypothetical protein
MLLLDQSQELLPHREDHTAETHWGVLWPSAAVRVDRS